MKNIKKTLILCILLGSFGQVLAKQDESTLLLTKNKQQLTLDFLNTNNVIAMQFDIVMNGLKPSSLSLTNCVKGLAESHTGVCKIVKNGNVRVVIFSASNEVLASGNIGVLTLKGVMMDSISFTQVKMIGKNREKVSASTLVDLGSEIGLKRPKSYK